MLLICVCMCMFIDFPATLLLLSLRLAGRLGEHGLLPADEASSAREVLDQVVEVLPRHWTALLFGMVASYTQRADLPVGAVLDAPKFRDWRPPFLLVMRRPTSSHAGR